jgi:hypothetical protein
MYSSRVLLHVVFLSENIKPSDLIKSRLILAALKYRSCCVLRAWGVELGWGRVEFVRTVRTARRGAVHFVLLNGGLRDQASVDDEEDPSPKTKESSTFSGTMGRWTPTSTTDV